MKPRRRAVRSNVFGSTHAAIFLAQRTPPFRETQNVKRNLRLARARTPAKNITAPIPLATPVPTDCHFRGEGNAPLAPRSFRAANPLTRNFPGGSRLCFPFGYRHATANAVGYHITPHTRNEVERSVRPAKRKKPPEAASKRLNARSAIYPTQGVSRSVGHSGNPRGKRVETRNYNRKQNTHHDHVTGI